MGGGGEQDIAGERADDAPVTEALDDMLAGDDSGLCAGLLDVLALLDEAARSGAPIDYALLADGMTACWDQLLPHLGAADDDLVKDLLTMRGGGLYALTFYSDVSEAGMIEFGERLVADYERALGAGHPDAWETRRNTARVYQR